MLCQIQTFLTPLTHRSNFFYTQQKVLYKHFICFNKTLFKIFQIFCQIPTFLTPVTNRSNFFYTHKKVISEHFRCFLTLFKIFQLFDFVTNSNFFDTGCTDFKKCLTPSFMIHRELQFELLLDPLR